jgi:DNA-directed RNA polymerase specialized sigma24 family protein
MAPEYTPSAASFAKLLQWLGPNRDQSAARYEEIRRKIIRFFICRGCSDCEDLADITINRVNRALDDPSFQYVGDPLFYFYGVAKNVRLEHLRRQSRITSEVPEYGGEPPLAGSLRYECLECCLARTASGDRQLLLDYYDYEPRGKSSRRQLLAEQLGIPMNALRIRLYRARNKLKECVSACIQESSSA